MVAKLLLRSSVVMALAVCLTAPVRAQSSFSFKQIAELETSAPPGTTMEVLGDSEMRGAAPITTPPVTTMPVLDTDTDVDADADTEQAPSTNNEAPETQAPVITEAPATEAPVIATEAPATTSPITEAPETKAPITEAPTKNPAAQVDGRKNEDEDVAGEAETKKPKKHHKHKRHHKHKPDQTKPDQTKPDQTKPVTPAGDGTTGPSPTTQAPTTAPAPVATTAATSAAPSAVVTSAPKADEALPDVLPEAAGEEDVLADNEDAVVAGDDAEVAGEDAEVAGEGDVSGRSNTVPTSNDSDCDDYDIAGSEDDDCDDLPEPSGSTGSEEDCEDLPEPSGSTGGDANGSEEDCEDDLPEPADSEANDEDCEDLPEPTGAAEDDDCEYTLAEEAPATEGNGFDVNSVRLNAGNDNEDASAGYGVPVVAGACAAGVLLAVATVYMKRRNEKKSNRMQNNAIFTIDKNPTAL